MMGEAMTPEPTSASSLPRGEGGETLEQLEAREAAKQRAAAEATRERQRRITEARASVDQGNDDTAAEIQERQVARVLLAEAEDPCPFKAVRADDSDILRAHFLIEGSKHMLELRSKAPEDGGRTLLHIAAFWGSLCCLEFLLEVGANVNAIDSSLSCTTPLAEAARAGHLEACKRLLQDGARVDCQDMQGDTIFHWCARKGRGSMIHHLLHFSEKAKTGSTRMVLDLENHRGRKAIDVAANKSVVYLIEKEYANIEKIKAAANFKLRKGLAKARVIGDKVENAQQLRVQKRRYQKHK